MPASLERTSITTICFKISCEADVSFMPGMPSCWKDFCWAVSRLSMARTIFRSKMYNSSSCFSVCCSHKINTLNYTRIHWKKKNSEAALTLCISSSFAFATMGFLQGTINQSINQSMDKPINQSIDQSIEQSSNQSINQAIEQSIDCSNNQSINQSFSCSIMLKVSSPQLDKNAMEFR